MFRRFMEFMRFIAGILEAAQNLIPKSQDLKPTYKSPITIKKVDNGK